MADHDRKTAPVVELIPTVDEQPTPGMRVLALQHGGCLVATVWTTRSAAEFDAWAPYPKIPRKVKNIQQARLM